VLESGVVPAAPIPPQIAAIERPVPELMTWYFWKALATTFAFPCTIVLFYFRYHTMRYRFDEEGIHMKWGIIFRHEIMLNYSRIQDIHLQSNIFERWLGLARIVVQTASGGSSDEMTLEGIPGHEAMRDFLYSRMRGARSHPESHDVSDPVAHALLEVAAELRRIRELIGERHV
jgi:putative membrane protein